MDLDQRRAAVASLWNLDDEIVLVGAGGLQPIHGTDQFHDFRAHPNYRYLTDAEHADDVLAYDPKEGWTHFVPMLSKDELVWHGGQQSQGTPLEQLDGWLAARAGRPVAQVGCAHDGVAADEGLTARVVAALETARRTKDADEQARMRAAADSTRFGFLAAMKEARPGVTERELQIKLEAAFLRAGARRCAFDTTVAAAENAAVLHFTPTARRLEAGDLLLIDAGAETGGYSSDCTRTFVVGSRPGAEQADLHQLVREVQESAVDKCVPGKEWREIHLEAHAQFAQGLADFGLFKGKVDDLIERDAVALFFPHGIGHLVGLAVHDSGGFAEGRSPSKEPVLKWLRADLPLEPGIAITVEPGLYFMPAVLEDPETRDDYRDIVDWLRVDSLMRFGGIRIEDTVIVTDGAPEVLTKDIPKGVVV